MRTLRISAKKTPPMSLSVLIKMSLNKASPIGLYSKLYLLSQTLLPIHKNCKFCAFDSCKNLHEYASFLQLNAFYFLLQPILELVYLALLHHLALNCLHLNYTILNCLQLLLILALQNVWLDNCLKKHTLKLFKKII